MDLNSKNKDPFGAAIRDYANTGNNTLEIEVFQEDFEPDIIPVKHLFRDYKNMPKIEKKQSAEKRAETEAIKARMDAAQISSVKAEIKSGSLAVSDEVRELV